MRKIRKKIVLYLLVSLTLVVGCACSAPKDKDIASPVPYFTPTQEMPGAVGQPIVDWREPVEVDRRARDFNGGYITYPYIRGGAEAQINASIFSTVKSYVEGFAQPLYADFDVMTNDNGLLCCRMYLLDIETYEPVDLLMLNYNVETGLPYTVDSGFYGTNQWRYVISDWITQQAEEKGFTLLADIKPIADSQLFYVYADQLVFVYRLYEIATYEAGQPEFAIPIARLSQYLTQDSVFRRFMDSASESG